MQILSAIRDVSHGILKSESSKMVNSCLTDSKPYRHPSAIWAPSWLPWHSVTGCSVEKVGSWESCGRPHLVKLFKELSAGLVDGADDGPAPLGQGFQERDHLEAGHAIQSAGEAEKERAKQLWAMGARTEVAFYFGVRWSSRLVAHLQPLCFHCAFL